MYCDKCGADNSDSAKYCRKCGLLIDQAEEETRVAAKYLENRAPMAPQMESGIPAAYQPPKAQGMSDVIPSAAGRMEPANSEDEAEIFSITPTLMFVKAGYVLAAFGALLLVAITSAFLSQFVSVWLSVLIGLLLFMVPAYYHFRQKLVRYTLTESKLEIDSGFISRTTRNVPIRRIQDVTVASGMTQRLLGFGNVVIDNASEEGGKVVLRNIDKPKYYADVLLKQMRRLEG